MIRIQNYVQLIQHEDLSIFLWLDLITFEFIFFLEKSIECLSLKCPLQVVLFSAPEKIAYSFNFLFDIFWKSIYWPMYTVWIREFHLLLPQLDLSRIELPKQTPSILTETLEHSICPGWSILFLYAPVHLKILSLS